jgi:hypothetical protein
MRALAEHSRLAWLVGSAMVVSIALGASPAEAAGPARPDGAVPTVLAAPGSHATGVTWHKLTLIHGWKPALSYSTGSPRWALQNGIVYLAGSLDLPSGTNGVFAVLPKAARPGDDLAIDVYTDGQSNGQLAIDTNGHLWLSGPGGGSASRAFSSLAGVSFPAAATHRTRLHLGSGWHQASAVDHGGPVSYALRGGVVYLSGELVHPSGTNEIATILPKGARPAHVLYMIIETDYWAPGVAEILPDGDLYVYGGDIASFGSLDGLSFPVGNSGWHSLALKNGWFSPQSSDHTGTPAYRVSGGVVYLTGAIRQNTTGGNSLFAVLPKADRPAHELYISIYTLSGNVGTLLIGPDGEMSAFGSDAWVLTSLAGVSFPLGS